MEFKKGYDMSNNRNNFAVVTLTKEGVRIWNNGIDIDSEAIEIHSPELIRDFHYKNGPKMRHDIYEDAATLAYFEKITKLLTSKDEILLIGHGHGKASAMVRFVQFLERRHPQIAHNIVDALDENLIALSDPQIKALAREWVDQHQ